MDKRELLQRIKANLHLPEDYDNNKIVYGLDNESSATLLKTLTDVVSWLNTK